MIYGKGQGSSVSQMESVEFIVVYDTSTRNMFGMRWLPPHPTLGTFPNSRHQRQLSRPQWMFTRHVLYWASIHLLKKWKKGAANVRAAHAELMAMWCLNRLQRQSRRSDGCQQRTTSACICWWAMTLNQRRSSTTGQHSPSPNLCIFLHVTMRRLLCY